MVFRKRAGMTLSVSMLRIGIGAATAVSVLNLSIRIALSGAPSLTLPRFAGEGKLLLLPNSLSRGAGEG